MADPFHYVEAPRRAPRKGGIRSVAEFRDAGSRLALGGVFEYVTFGCSMAAGDARLCYPSDADPQAEKVRDGIETEEGIGPAFGSYAGVECWLDGADYEAEARAALLRSEDRVIEQALTDWLAGETPTDTDSVVEAIASAENQADDEYPYAPVLFMNRADVVIAASNYALSYDRDGNVWSPNGTPVISSSKQTFGVVTILGALTVLQSPVGVYRTRDLTLNREFAIAERANGLLVDCGYAASFTTSQ